MNIIIKSILAIGVAVILIDRFANGNFIGRELIIAAVAIFIVWTISSYSRGQWEDHLVTFIIIGVAAIMYYASWWNFENILGFELNNPVTMGYFVILTFFTLIVLISRYTYLNVVKAAGWAIGLATIGLFAFTYSVWGTLKLCEIDDSVRGIQDPFSIVLPVYISWAIMIGLTFFSEMLCWGQTKYIVLGVSGLIAAGLLGYTAQRCETAVNKMKAENENENEKEAEYIKNEPSWINNGAYIATIAAWFNLFIGHYISSAFFAFVGYYILDQCAPKNDPRVMSVNILALIYLIVGFVKGIQKLT